MREVLRGARHGEPKRGASTITMQTAKNLFLSPDRTWTRKGLEAYLTVLLEALWPKRRIMETYLNIAEWNSGRIYSTGRAPQTKLSLSLSCKYLSLYYFDGCR